MSRDIVRKPVQSSNVKSIGYDSVGRVLEVEFHNGGVYHYQDVDPEDHKRLMAAQSVGSHLHTHIKGRFESVKHRPSSERIDDEG